MVIVTLYQLKWMRKSIVEKPIRKKRGLNILMVNTSLFTYADSDTVKYWYSQK